jgi:hypothetical protein
MEQALCSCGRIKAEQIEPESRLRALAVSWRENESRIRGKTRSMAVALVRSPSWVKALTRGTKSMLENRDLAIASAGSNFFYGKTKHGTSKTKQLQQKLVWQKSICSRARHTEARPAKSKTEARIQGRKQETAKKIYRTNFSSASRKI